MKIGGNSWNNAPMSKRGIKTSYKCKLCGRQYKLEHYKNNHEKLCEDYKHGSNNNN